MSALHFAPMTKRTALELLHDEHGFSSRRIAEICKIDVAGLARIERGEVQPKRETARDLHRFYRGVVPLGVIYDPAHKESIDWYKKAQYTAAIVTAFNLIKHKHPELTKRRLDARRRR